MNPFMATIMLWAPDFAPRQWAYCHGQLLSVASHTALFSLIGTLYGGDGRTTFALPDFRSRIPVGTGTGHGLSSYALASKGGTESAALGVNHLPQHWHSTSGLSVTIKTDSGGSTSSTPSPSADALGRLSVPPGLGTHALYNNNTPNVPLREGEITGNTDTTGNSEDHENRQPYTALHYIICLAGIYPSRS